MTDARGSGTFLDEIDTKLVAELTQDGRLGTTELAARLKTTPKTVLSRLRRLEDSGVLKVVAVTDMEACGYPIMVVAAVQVEGRPPGAVAGEIAQLPEAILVDLVLGDYDVNVWLLATGVEHVEELLNEGLGRIRGVADVESVACLHVHHWTRNHAIVT